MQIILDSTIVDGYVQGLATSLARLEATQERSERLAKEAEANQLLTIKQACSYLGNISEETLMNYRRLGLEGYKKGKNAIWFRRGDIDSWLSSGKVSRRQ